MDKSIAILDEGRLSGRFLAASHRKLRELALRLNIRSVVNVAECPAR
jgi:hypothetical protein